MGATTPGLALPYPTGTDRVMDGDNAIQALAERIEAVYPRGRIGFGTHAGPQTGIGTVATDLTGLTLNPITIVGTRTLKLTAYVTAIARTSVGSLKLRIVEGTTTLNSNNVTCPANTRAGLLVTALVVATPGAHTYKAQLNTDANTVDTEASSTQFGYLIVEDVGP